MARSTSLGGVLARLAQALGINAVPVAGYFGEGWSAGTALAVYWVESLFGIAFVSARIALHRRWTRKAGHFRAPAWNRPPGAPLPELGSGTLLSGYLGIAVFFTLAHGLFLALLLFLVLPDELGAKATVVLADLGRGTVGVVAFLLLGLGIDLLSLRERPFHWIDLVTQRAMGRIFVVHLTIVLGMGAVAFFGAPGALFGLFAVLKTLVDLGGVLPPREAGTEPPWLLRPLDRIESPAGEGFSAHWRRTRAAELAQREAEREANERVVDG